MRGQSELIIFILLFIVSIFLFTSAALWSRSIFQENLDFARLEASEKFMKDLDKEVTNLIKFGGSKEVEYNVDGTIELVNETTIEVKVPTSLELQENWINISEGDSFIREVKKGGTLFLQLIYPEKDYRVEFFTENTRITQPAYVRLEKNLTYFDAMDAITVIKIKISFV